MKSLLVAFFIVSAPVYAQHNHEEHAQHTEVKRKTINEKEKANALEVLAKNEILFNAFLKKDASLAEKTAKELQQLLKSKNTPVLKEVNAQAPKLLSIKSSNKPEENLKAYESFLNPLIKVVQSYDVGGRYNVFSCPMVKKSWLQDVQANKEVRNVYAMDMLECGKQETNF